MGIPSKRPRQKDSFQDENVLRFQVIKSRVSIGVLKGHITHCQYTFTLTAGSSSTAIMIESVYSSQQAISQIELFWTAYFPP